MFKHLIQKILERYVKQYFKKHPEVKLIVVVGSVGKTSTKHAIATILSQRYRVAMEEENHNSELSVPVAILGIEYPDKIHSLSAWLTVFRAARRRIKQPTGTDVIIQELGTDHPGDIAKFGAYLQPDIAVVSAVTPEHMEFFGDIEAVAREELAAANFSKSALINRDDIDGRFAEFLTNPNLNTYGTTGAAEYRFEVENFTLDGGYEGDMFTPETTTPIKATIHLVGEHSLRPAMAAAAIGFKMGLSAEQITTGLASLRPVNGRMNILRGAEQSLIIDDSYNSSPAAASAALQTLYSLAAPQRIAVLGSMNELGVSSEQEHQQLGALCDPSLLAWVVTVGEQAEQYLAPAARARGCQVKSFHSAIDAGGFIRSILEPGAVVLVKGSQGDIYLEEAIKVFLHSTDDEDRLVRQTAAWRATKATFFSKFT